MNNVVEYEAALLIALQHEEPLKLRMKLEGMGMPLDAQDEVIRQASSLDADDFQGIARVIESHGYGNIAERLQR